MKAAKSEQRAPDDCTPSNIGSVASKLLDDPVTRGDSLRYYAKLKYKEFA
jgi:hypothetical protein